MKGEAIELIERRLGNLSLESKNIRRKKIYKKNRKGRNRLFKKLHISSNYLIPDRFFTQDLMIESLLKLPVKEILNKKLISKSYAKVIDLNSFWSLLLERDYGVTEHNNCRKVYQKIYSVKDKGKKNIDYFWYVIGCFIRAYCEKSSILLTELKRVETFLSCVLDHNKKANIMIPKAYNQIFNFYSTIVKNFRNLFDKYVGEKISNVRIIEIFIANGEKYYNTIMEMGIQCGYLYNPTKENKKIFEKRLDIFLEKASSEMNLLFPLVYVPLEQLLNISLTKKDISKLE